MHTLVCRVSGVVCGSLRTVCCAYRGMASSSSASHSGSVGGVAVDTGGRGRSRSRPKPKATRGFRGGKFVAWHSLKHKAVQEGWFSLRVHHNYVSIGFGTIVCWPCIVKRFVVGCCYCCCYCYCCCVLLILLLLSLLLFLPVLFLLLLVVLGVCCCFCCFPAVKYRCK